ncbi:Histidine phosphatase superfamily (branch 2) family protein [Cryptosporidium meleagridis]|uniref:Histidine phosphatase superfamily (Branch 2) family protein n=1 Tax=Cryptosporidium meleagridis TaxID=93969 RepID=A0A2P4YZT0_9CRYT|nr:Histidine phosphatase superfamily (branch 2) family protein [Cryptosporidium meleagridis]
MRVVVLMLFFSLVGCVVKQERKNQAISSNSDAIEGDLVLVENGYLGKFLNPTEFSLCADTSNLEEIKQIPRLGDEELFNRLELIQLQVVSRHGARTPVKPSKCWEGYKQNWDCSDLKSLTSTSAIERRSKTRTLKFSKHYETKQWRNNLTNTCKMGQLISQGYEQHRINGKLLAEAYFKQGENLVTRNGLRIDKFKNQMYIRSSDTQRTIVSAAALITSLLENIFGKEETFQKFSNLPIYTMDFHSEYLFANKNLVDNSRVLKYVFISKKYQEILQDRKKLHMELEKDAKLNDLSGSWPFELLDCISMTICSGDDNKLPEAFFKNNLLERTLETIEKEVSSVFTWNNSIIAKAGISRFMYEIREFILDAILFHENKNDELSNIKELCSNSGPIEAIMSQDLLMNFEYLLYPLCNKYDHHNSSKKEIKAPKFILFSGHDLTLIPLLASLNAWDDHLPPYASTINIEIYYDPSEKREYKRGTDSPLKLESIQKNLPYYVRLLYNGLVITDKLKGCEGNEICHAYKFFQTSKFAKFEKIGKKEILEPTNKFEKSLNKINSVEDSSNEGQQNPGSNFYGVYRINTLFLNYSLSFLLGALTSIILLFLIEAMRSKSN